MFVVYIYMNIKMNVCMTIPNASLSFEPISIKFGV